MLVRLKVTRRPLHDVYKSVVDPVWREKRLVFIAALVAFVGEDENGIRHAP